MIVDFLEIAKLELEEAMDYYNLQSEGLGYELAAKIKAGIQRIVQYPQAWTPLSERTRRCRTKRFPYGIIYQFRDNTILVVAIQNLNRHPDTWKSRLN